MRMRPMPKLSVSPSPRRPFRPGLEERCLITDGPRMRFARAIEPGDAVAAEVAARDIGDVRLADALEFVALVWSGLGDMISANESVPLEGLGPEECPDRLPEAVLVADALGAPAGFVPVGGQVFGARPVVRTGDQVPWRPPNPGGLSFSCSACAGGGSVGRSLTNAWSIASACGIPCSSSVRDIADRIRWPRNQEVL